MSKALIIENGTIITGGLPPDVLTGMSVLIDGGSIARVAPAREFKGMTVRRIDAAGKVVMPGFVNAHTHSYSAFARGIGGIAPSGSFPEVLSNLWWRLDRALTLDGSYLSGVLTMIDAIRHGTTTIIDHHASPHAVAGSLDALSRAACESGIRACFCYEVSDRDGAEIASSGIDENVSFIKRAKEDRSRRIAGMFGLHASFTLSDVTLERAADAGRSLNAGFHVHLAEAIDDRMLSLERYGRAPVERFAAAGIFGPGSVAAHGVHLDPYEMALIAASGTTVVHNPQSNLNNAVGIAAVAELQRHGVPVGLGTDAMTEDMREELRVGLWAQRLRAENPSTGFDELLSALMLVNPSLAGSVFGLALGRIEEGYAADIILIDYEPTTPMDGTNAYGHLVFGIAHRPVDTTIVNGTVIMEHQRLVNGMDEESICAKAREEALATWKRLS